MGLFGLWFTAGQLVMLPDENRRLVWYAIAAALLAGALAARLLRMRRGATSPEIKVSAAQACHKGAATAVKTAGGNGTLAGHPAL